MSYSISFHTLFKCLSMFVGAICHDLDHRGFNNKFMIDIGSPLAAIYSTSTMEHHHFNMTVIILQQVTVTLEYLIRVGYACWFLQIYFLIPYHTFINFKRNFDLDTLTYSIWYKIQSLENFTQYVHLRIILSKFWSFLQVFLWYANIFVKKGSKIWRIYCKITSMRHSIL